MAFTSKFTLVSSLMIVLILMINTKPSLTQTTGDLINQICRSTEDFGFCNTTFFTHLKSPNANIADLTQITIEVSSTQATQTLDFIRQTLATTTDPSLKSALSECRDAYAQITQSYATAAVSFFEKDYQDVEKVERPAARLESSCEATLSAPPTKGKNGQHILDERSKEMRVMIVMSVNAVEMLLRVKWRASFAKGAPSPI